MATTPPTKTITLRYDQIEQPFYIPSGVKSHIVIKGEPALLCEVDEQSFVADGSLLCPDPPRVEGVRARIGVSSGLDAIAAAMQRAAAENRFVQVTGHCEANQEETETAEARAKGVVALMKGDEAAWIELAQEAQVEEAQRFLSWTSTTHNWNDSPGKPDGNWSTPWAQTLEEFRKSYKEAGQGSPPSQAGMQSQDWKVMFALMQQALEGRIDLEQIRGALTWCEPPVVGCAGDYPSDRKTKTFYRSSGGARVDILLFKEAPDEQRSQDPFAPAAFYRFEALPVRTTSGFVFSA